MYHNNVHCPSVSRGYGEKSTGRRTTRSRTELVAEVGLEVALGADELDVGTVLDDTLVLLELEVVFTVDVCEAPLARDDDLLATGELVASAAQSLLDDLRVCVLAADGKDDLANVDTGNLAVRLAESTTHTSLQPVADWSACALVSRGRPPARAIDGPTGDTPKQRMQYDDWTLGLGA